MPQSFYKESIKQFQLDKAFVYNRKFTKTIQHTYIDYKLHGLTDARIRGEFHVTENEIEETRDNIKALLAKLEAEQQDLRNKHEGKDVRNFCSQLLNKEQKRAFVLRIQVAKTHNRVTRYETSFYLP